MLYINNNRLTILYKLPKLNLRVLTLTLVESKLSSMAQCDPFRVQIMEIAEKLTSDDVLKIRYLYNQCNPETDNAIQVIWSLQNAGIISTQEDLSLMLSKIKRKDLGRGVLKSCSSCHSTVCSDEEALTQLACLHYHYSKLESALLDNGRLRQLPSQAQEQLVSLQKKLASLQVNLACRNAEIPSLIPKHGNVHVASPSLEATNGNKKKPVVPPRFKRPMSETQQQCDTQLMRADRVPLVGLTTQLGHVKLKVVDDKPKSKSQDNSLEEFDISFESASGSDSGFSDPKQFLKIPPDTPSNDSKEDEHGYKRLPLHPSSQNEYAVPFADIVKFARQ